MWSFQTQQISAVHSCTAPPGGGRGISLDLPLVGSLLEEAAGLTVPRIMVYVNPGLRAPASALSLQPASPLRYLGALPHSGNPQSSCDPEGPETTLSHEGSTPRSATGATSLSGADF